MTFGQKGIFILEVKENKLFFRAVLKLERK